MTITANFPAIRPSLNLDFANTKKLDPRITFSRPSSATYYDGKTVAKAEENLLTRSQEFEAWTLISSTVTSNSSVAPDGTTTADTLTASSASAFHAIARAVIGVISGLTYQVSVFAKAGTAQFLQIFSNNAFNATDRVNFDLSSGTVTAASGAYSGASIYSIGNGWHRCVVPIVAVAYTDPGIYFAITDSSTASRANAWTATGSETIFLWGAQLEQRAQATAYTPTTSQPITNYIPLLQTAAAGVARFDHNPVTGESLGLFIEEQRTNFLRYSEEFNNGWWSKSNSVIATNAAISPDGTLSADKLIMGFGTDPAAANANGISQNIAVDSGVYTYSIYAKACEFYILRLRESIVTGAFLDVNLLTGQITNGSAAQFVTPLSTNVGNGWWRISWTSPDVTTTSVKYGIRVGQTGDGYSGIYIWNAQLEQGSSPTSPIKTGASQVTRAADPNLVAALGQLGAGTIYMDATVRPGNTLATSGSTTFAATASTRQKTAVAYDAASTLKSINGAAVTSSAGSQGGSNISIAPGATGWIKRLSIYQKKLSEAQLQTLTA